MKTYFNSPCRYSTLRQCKAQVANWSYCQVVSLLADLFKMLLPLLYDTGAHHQLQLPVLKSPLGTSGSCRNPEMRTPHSPTREKWGIWEAGRGDSVATGLVEAGDDVADERAAGRQPWPPDRRGNRESQFGNLQPFCTASQDLGEFASSSHKAHASLLGFTEL